MFSKNGGGEMKRPPTKQKGTLDYFRSSRWGELNTRTINGTAVRLRGKSFSDYILKGTELRMGRKEFYSWCETQWPTIEGFYLRNETPSLDRIDPKGHYEITNLRVISLKENVARGLTSRWAPDAVHKKVSGHTSMEVKRFIQNKRKLRDLRRRFFAAARKQLNFIAERVT